jgi:hypothetical protein
MPDQMTRYLAPQPLTYAQQREADERMGKLAAAITRPARRLAARIRVPKRGLRAGGQFGPPFRKPVGVVTPQPADRACQ